MPSCEGTYPAPAKVNLGLYIRGKRPDGYHAIETIMHVLDVCDQLTFRLNRAGVVRLSCNSAALATDERNLVTRAALDLQRAGRVRQGIDIHLDKRIPLAAGLGGGSSDAATTLLVLNRLWGLNWDVKTLHQQAAQLGSDVPFFLGGPIALAQGRGEELTPLPSIPPLAGLLVNPGFGVSAGWAYGRFTGASSLSDDSMAAIADALRRHDLARLGEVMLNDLEPGVTAVHPIIGEIAQALRVAGARVALMSGSGPTVYGLFEDHERARRAAADLSERRAWWILPCSTLSRSPLAELQG